MKDLFEIEHAFLIKIEFYRLKKLIDSYTSSKLHYRCTKTRLQVTNDM